MDDALLTAALAQLRSSGSWRAADPAAVEAFEARCGFALPDDYRRFVSEVGNGGRAGPTLVIEPLGSHDADAWDGLLGEPGRPFPLHVDPGLLEPPRWARP